MNEFELDRLVRDIGHWYEMDVEKVKLVDMPVRKIKWTRGYHTVFDFVLPKSFLDAPPDVVKDLIMGAFSAMHDITFDLDDETKKWIEATKSPEARDEEGARAIAEEVAAQILESDDDIIWSDYDVPNA